jgi:thiamine kinase-like enzyme
VTRGGKAARALARRMLPELAAHGTLEARPISGGLNQRTFLVAAGERRYVLRLPTAGASGLLDVAAEARVTSAAARAGIAPAVAAYDEESQALMTVYRDARPWDGSAARRPANIERAAALLRRLHAVEARVPTFAAAAIAQSYLAETLTVARARFGERADRWSRELSAAAARYDARSATALCHNDLVAANVLDDGALCLVDFEYAVRGAPILDLASLAAMNGFGASEQQTLLAGYFAGTAPAYSAAELADAVRMVRLMAFFWALLLEQRAPDAAPYARLAARIGEELQQV